MSQPSTRARIAIVEDDRIVRDYLQETLREDFDVIATASSAKEARALPALRPDLFLLDIGLPDGNGLELTAEFKAVCDARILILTSFGDRETVVGAIQAGADGYLLKDSSVGALVEGVGVTLAGGAPISAAAAVFLLERLRPAQNEARAPAPVPADTELTPREIELLRVFAKGASYKEAARALNISPQTVGGYVKSIYRKLEVHSRGEAVYQAMRARKLDLG